MSSWSDAFAAFQNLIVVPAPIDDSAVVDVIAQLRATHVNGGALFGRWLLPENPTIDAYAARNALDVAGFFTGLLRSEGVRSELTELQVPLQYGAPPRFGAVSSLSLECELANVLHQGGAYHRPTQGSARDAKRLARAFCDALIGDRFEDVSIYACDEAWSPWFHGVAWDTTWFGLDARDRTCWLLCRTDSD